jgi:hypothetical protein
VLCLRGGPSVVYTYQMEQQNIFPWFKYAKWLIILLRRNSDWCCIPQHASRIHCSCRTSPTWTWWHVVSTRHGTPTLPSWCQDLSWQQFSRPMDRTQQHFKSYGKTLNGLAHPSPQQIWWPLVSHLLTAVNCVTKLTVVILNTYTKFANSLRANADVCNGLGY